MIRLSAVKKSHLQLNVQQSTWTKTRRRASIRDIFLQLTTWSANWSVTHHHRRRPTMISHRQMQPVWLQRIIFAAKHDSDIGRMIARRIKIGIIADATWQQHGHCIVLVQMWLQQWLRSGCIARRQQILYDVSRHRPCAAVVRHERVESFVFETLTALRQQCKQSQRCHLVQVQYIVTDAHSDALRAIRFLKHTKRNVLNRKVRISRNFHP
mmetsp:Transcript_43339/g.71609  ORF Transcript_43339/g.71609 Transcript_43339/m.71609 type:complete len:211 (+) Transcript_43339:789-1421(+)